MNYFEALASLAKDGITVKPAEYGFETSEGLIYRSASEIAYDEPLRLANKGNKFFTVKYGVPYPSPYPSVHIRDGYEWQECLRGSRSFRFRRDPVCGFEIKANDECFFLEDEAAVQKFGELKEAELLGEVYNGIEGFSLSENENGRYHLTVWDGHEGHSISRDFPDLSADGLIRWSYFMIRDENIREMEAEARMS